MSFGGLTFAIGLEYQRMAYALALSLKRYNIPLTVVVHREDHSRGLFKKLENEANIVTIAGKYGRFSYEALAYDLSPYDATMKFDADMLVPAEVTMANYQTFIESFSLVPGLAMTLNGTANTSSIYRKAETQLDLPLVYSACFGFTKSDIAERFYRKVAFLFEEWYALKNLSRYMPATTDSVYATAWTALGLPWSIDYALPFIHMKPGIASARLPPKWMDKVPYSLARSGVLRVNSHVVRVPFHYYEKKFLTDPILEVLESNVPDFQSSDW